METKDIIDIVMNFVMPLLAVILAQQVIAKRERSNRTMQLFYDLVGHLNAFKIAFYKNSSHARRWGEFLMQYDAARNRIEELSKKRVFAHTEEMRQEIDAEIDSVGRSYGSDEDLRAESVEACKERRLASSDLVADCLLLEMLYQSKARPLIASIKALNSKADIFDGRSPHYFNECFPIEQDLPSMLERLHNEVTAFWAIQFREMD